MILFAEGNEVARERLLQIAVIHKRFRLTREMYDLWRVALLQVLAKNDPEFSAEQQAAWNTVLSQGIEFFLEHST
jgi:septum formation topological specificity factor MinE